MKRIVLAVLFSLGVACAPSSAQSINGIASQLMSGFAPGVNGAPIIATVSNYIGNTAPITNQVECTAANCPVGLYLVLVTLSPTTSPTLGTISLTLSFTDSAQAQTITAINAGALTSKTPMTAVYPFWSTGAANITWSTTAAGITGSYVYDVHVRLIKLS